VLVTQLNQCMDNRCCASSCLHTDVICLMKSLYILGRLAAKIARKDSLALKLSLRPDRDELIARNIIRVVSEKEIQETKEAIGAKLIRYGALVLKFCLVTGRLSPRVKNSCIVLEHRFWIVCALRRELSNSESNV